MLYTALLFGLISSLHCIGMCGPIAVMLPVNQNNQAVKVLQILIYHLGRMTSYAFLGLLFGSLGRGLYLAGIQQWISIVVGLVMIGIAVIPENKYYKLQLSKPVYRFVSYIKSTLGSQFKRRTPDAFFTIGVVNGLLPCGMVYAALFGAMAMQSVGVGVGYMVLYGLGTVPLMSLVVLMRTWVTQSVRNKFQKVIPFTMFIIGLLFVLRGMGLDIDYLSPATLDLFIQPVANCHN